MVHPCAPCFGVIESHMIVIPQRSRGTPWHSRGGSSRDVSTSLDMTRGLLEDHRTLWVVAVLIVVLFAIANLPWQLDDYDQAKQAFTSFEMVKEGHWLYQHTPQERIATKPPMVGWISAV